MSTGASPNIPDLPEGATLQQIVDHAVSALPETGEISFDDWKRIMRTTGNLDAIRMWHNLKQRKSIAVRLDIAPDGTATTYFRRPE